MKKTAIILLISVFICTTLVYGQTNNQLTNEQNAWLSKANRHEKNGWIYLHIEGMPEERGFQHGYLLAEEIKESLRILSEAWYYRTALDWKWLVQKAGKMFVPKIDIENLNEIEGIVEGMKAAGVVTNRDEIVTYNGIAELWMYWWPSVKDTISPNSHDPKKQSCSSFIVELPCSIRTFPGFDNLRNDPEFNAILNKIEDKRASLRAQVWEMEQRGELNF